jgi:hypothetical protein
MNLRRVYAGGIERRPTGVVRTVLREIGVPMRCIVNVDWHNASTLELVVSAGAASLVAHIIRTTQGGSVRILPADPYADLDVPGIRGQLLSRVCRNRDQTRHPVAKSFFRDWAEDIKAATPRPEVAVYEPPVPFGAPTDEELAEMNELVAAEMAERRLARSTAPAAPAPVVDPVAAAAKLRDECLDELRLMAHNDHKFSPFEVGSKERRFRTVLCGHLKPYVEDKLCLKTQWHKVALQIWEDCETVDKVSRAFENPLHWDTHVSRAETAVYLKAVDAAEDAPEQERLLAEGLLQKALTHPGVNKETVTRQVARFSGSLSHKRMVFGYFPDRLVAELTDNGAELSDEDMADYSSADGETTGPQAAPAGTGTGEPSTAGEANAPVPGPTTTTTPIVTIAETPSNV